MSHAVHMACLDESRAAIAVMSYEDRPPGDVVLMPVPATRRSRPAGGPPQRPTALDRSCPGESAGEAPCGELGRHSPCRAARTRTPTLQTSGLQESPDAVTSQPPGLWGSAREMR